MTCIYFVRHAQSLFDRDDDRTRPLTAEGMNDSRKVTELLSLLPINRFYSSPYTRSADTIRESAEFFNMKIQTDERFRERRKGTNGNEYGMFAKRWDDFNYCEEGGESLKSVQERNILALTEILGKHENENIVIGTHGTALSTILHYYDNSFGCSGFLRIIDFMPYIIRLDFNGNTLVSREELLIIKKEFKGKERADISTNCINI